MLRKMVLDSVPSPHTRRNYGKALDHLFAFSASRPLSRALLMERRAGMEALSPSTVNVRLSAVRKMVGEARRNNMIGSDEAASLTDIPNLRQQGTRLGNWLTREQAKELLAVPDRSTLKGKRDLCILALLVGCALRRHELANLYIEEIQMRENRWVIADLRGKGGRVRTVAVPVWVKQAINAWTTAAGIVVTVSRQLVADYGRGYSEKNLRRMVQFAEAFPEVEIVVTLSRQLSWSHFSALLPLSQPSQRDFYAEMARIEGWSVRTLRARIDSMLYERTALSKQPEALIRQELAMLRSKGDLTPAFSAGRMVDAVQDPIHEMTNRFMDATAVVDSSFRELWNRLGEVSEFESRVLIMEKYLLDRVPRASVRNEITGSANFIFRERGAVGIAALASAHSLGLRQFERRFEREMGVSPKSFARIARFQFALDAKLVSPQRTWLDISHSFVALSRITDLATRRMARSALRVTGKSICPPSKPST
jgi:site-specific recombinase XerD